MYRYVSIRWRLYMQLATLLATALVGLSLALTPQPASHPMRLTEFEAAMGSLPPSIALLACGTVGLVSELLMHRRGPHRTWFIVVSTCHAICFGLYAALSVSSLIGMIRTGQWYSFGAPVLGILLAFLHLMYLQRRREFPYDIRKYR